MKSISDQNIDIRYLTITSMTNSAVLQIGTSGFVKREAKPEGDPTPPLFIGPPAPLVPL